MTEIARAFTFATTNRRDIVRRLMGTSKEFKRYNFSQALALFRACERRGWVTYGDSYIVVYFDYDTNY